MKSDLSVIILTYNESKHLRRCLQTVEKIAKEVFIVDSYSSDNTVEIASSMGAKVLKNNWINYSSQFNWALDNCPISTRWVMRLDADEIISEKLADELSAELNIENKNVSGFVLNRGHIFLNKKLMFGGNFPTKLLRVWEYGNGYCENKWMDEHIILKKKGEVKCLKSSFWDYNLNDISWWTQKHNQYATREAIDQLIRKHSLLEFDKPDKDSTFQSRIKKILKSSFYEKLPKSIRASIFFFYRYILLLGFLDGYPGLVWNFLQGFWYRFLVDVKVNEIERKSKERNVSIIEIIKEDYGFDIYMKK